jgi:hypothetical protein
MIDNNKKDIETLLKETDDISFQIKDLKRKNRVLTAENDEKIDILQVKLTEIEHKMEETLEETKEDAVKVRCGWAHFLTMEDTIVFTDKTITEIETKYPAEADRYIKTEKSLKLNPLKRDIESGEIVLENMSKVPQEKRFKYKFTGD